MALHIGIDTGGTYTDAVLFDPAVGVLAKAKALTTKHELSLGIGEALAKVLPLEKAAEISLVSVSTTLATNALVEGHGNPVGLLLIGYPPASLERAGLREALRGDPVAFIGGGHNPLGEEQAPLDLTAARAAIVAQAGQVQSFAVAGFFAVRNPAHEIAVRQLVREITGKPVTCAHELSSNLDAPRRALTAVLNARLIPQIDHLVRAVQGLMVQHGLKAPLMVVKGDGSLISDTLALASPVETILSGPAASVVGAQFLAGVPDCFVSDIGGTTTDIAVLHGGKPVLNLDGATVGGFRTMVEAVAVHTFGLGGDSEVRFEGKTLLVGPRRAVSLSLLATLNPSVLTVLREQLEASATATVNYAGRFGLRLRRLPDDAALKPAEQAVWDAMAEGPVALQRLAANYLNKRAFDRLVDRGLAIVSTFTPSDAMHLLGKQSGWSLEAAEVGAKLIAKEWDPRVLALAVEDRVVALTGEYLIEAALDEEAVPAERPAGLARWLLDRGLDGKARPDRLAVTFALGRPIVAIGAPAGAYYDEVARRLGNRAVIPPDGDVCNAVGAVASGVVQRAKALITQPVEGIFRLHLSDSVKDFMDLEVAAAFGQTTVLKQAEDMAALAGADAVTCEVTRKDVVVDNAEGRKTFIESVIVATAAGRPRLAMR